MLKLKKCLIVYLEINLLFLSFLNSSFYLIDLFYPNDRDIDISKIDTKTKPAVEPKDFVLDFGQKHNGRTIQEIYEVDPQYLKWAAENMRKEPAHTYIATFMQDK